MTHTVRSGLASRWRHAAKVAALLAAVSAVFGMALIDPAGARPRPRPRTELIHANGSSTFVLDPASIEVLEESPHCVIRYNSTTTRTGTLAGVTSGVSEGRFFAPCEALLAGEPAFSISRHVHHSVGPDGTERTLTTVTFTSPEGNTEGFIVVSGDLQGVLRLEGTSPPGQPAEATYEGLLVRTRQRGRH